MTSASSLNTTTTTNNNNNNKNKNTTAAAAASSGSSKATSSTAAASAAAHAGNSANTRISTSRHYSSSSSSANSPHPACAACKYQRRRCTPDCILAPHFPAHLQGQFQAAHRLFGVKNIHRIIDDLDPVQRSNAMRSIIFESNARVRDPVGGCLRIICELERQIQCDSAELVLVLQQLAICRAQVEGQSTAMAPSTVVSDLEANTNIILNGNEDQIDINGDSIYLQLNQSQQHQQSYYDYFYDDGGSGCENNNEEGKGSNSNHSFSSNINHNSGSVGAMLQVQELSMLSLQQQQQQQQQQQDQEEQHQQQFGIEEDEVKPICDMFEVRQVLDDDDDEGDEEHDSNNLDVNKGGEPFHCRLGLGFSCY